MSDQLETVFGLLVAAGLLGGIGLILIGMVMYYVLGRLSPGQKFMGAGAQTILWTIYAGVAYQVIKASRDIPAWSVVRIVAIVLFTLFVQQLAKRYQVK